MSVPPRYDIATVADFLTVPPDRRDACLAEFATWLAIAEDVKALTAPAAWDGVFRWVDDGETNIGITVKVTSTP
jgi:hypothetical protein